MISFWEQQSFVNADFIIVGGGITGLSAALSLRERHPNKEIILFERGIFPSGASTKNAGFACFGSLTEILSDLKVMREKELLTLVEARRKGLSKLRKRLGKSKIDYQQLGGYELISEQESYALDHLEKINNLLFPLFGEPVFKLKNKLINKFGFNSAQIKALVFNPFEGQVDTGKLIKALIRKATQENISIYTGAEVVGIEQKSKGVDVKVQNSPSEELCFKAKKVLLSTNAFTKKLFPKIELEPGRGQVLVTEPIIGLPFKGTFHMDEGFYYFRNFKDRIIFGGGRNLDFKAETTTELNITSLIQEDLKLKLEKIILPKIPFKIAQSWAGIMAFGKNKKPIIKKVSPDVALSVRLGGMGVAIGTTVGEEGAKIISTND